jgi:nitrogen fixation protein NifX
MLQKLNNIVRFILKFAGGIMSENPGFDCVASTNIDEQFLKVAFASSDGETVNQHFGSSQGFVVYGISDNEKVFMTSKDFPKEKKDGNEDKLKPKLKWLVGSDIVYCGSIGGSATKQLVALGAHPAVVKGGPDIEEIIEELQAELSGTPSPMLERIIQLKKPRNEDRFDTMDDEGWDE